MRIGHGFDLHRLEPVGPEGRGQPFILAGIVFDHPRGPVAHSDGDAVYHAVTDALLGRSGRTTSASCFPTWTRATAAPTRPVSWKPP